MKIEVYSDGSGATKNKPGGYGYVVVVNGFKFFEGSGYIPFATNNDAELAGAIEGLRSLNGLTFNFSDSNEVEFWLVSDSQIILNWANGSYQFKQEDKMDKYNQLRGLVKQFNVKTRWVHGHNGDPNNERCDKLANAARLQEKI